MIGLVVTACVGYFFVQRSAHLSLAMKEAFTEAELNLPKLALMLGIRHHQLSEY